VDVAAPLLLVPNGQRLPSLRRCPREEPVSAEENVRAMRLFLSSWRLDKRAKALTQLIGAGVRTAVVLNASDNLSDFLRAERLEEERRVLEMLSLPAFELDLRVYFGHHAALRSALKGVGLIWVTGGNVFVLREAIRRSGLDDFIGEELRSGALAYGGYSAGACVAGQTLRGLEIVDDATAVNEPIWQGLGLVNCSIAPHYRSDHPESKSIEEVVGYFEARRMPYRPLRDGQALIVRGGTSRVVEWAQA
jgi:dipeptidase E